MDPEKERNNPRHCIPTSTTQNTWKAGKTYQNDFSI